VRAITSGVFHPAQEQRVVNPYVPLLASLVIAVVFSLVFVGLSKFFGPHRPTATKTALYECGMPTIGPVHQRFSVKFYLVALLFVLFDIEVVFMYPWAVVYKDLLKENASLILGGMVSFMGVLFVGYLYALRKRAFDWTR
jgi:NADH-quinone oxidoreductase subunit A